MAWEPRVLPQSFVAGRSSEELQLELQQLRLELSNLAGGFIFKVCFQFPFFELDNSNWLISLYMHDLMILM